MNTTVIPETELEAQDLDKDDVLFYTLQEVTPVSDPYTSSRPALRPVPLCVLPASQAESQPLLPRAPVTSSPWWVPTCPLCGWTGRWTSTRGRA